MAEVKLTWGKVAKVWWSLLWRGLLFGLLAGFVSGFIIGFVGTLAHIDKIIITLLSCIVGALTSIPTGMWVVKNVIKKRFSDFCIALISDTT